MKRSDVTEWLGYVFCEFSFRWHEAFDGLFDVPFYEWDWRWHHHISSFIGGKAYSIGCWFYSVGDE